MNLFRTRIAPTLFFAGVLLLTGCEPNEDTADASMAAATEEQADESATARVEPLADSGVQGDVTFQAEDEGVRVTANLSGLSEGAHGFHIHENGDCGPGEDGTPGGAAGGHFAPNSDPHGAPTDSAGAHHTGDMGNIMADASGEAELDTTFSFLALSGSESIVGKAMMIHSGRDDLTSQPSGDAGDRVGCGIIEMEDMDDAAMDTTGSL